MRETTARRVDRRIYLAGIFLGVAVFKWGVFWGSKNNLNICVVSAYIGRDNSANTTSTTELVLLSGNFLRLENSTWDFFGS